MSYFCFQFLLGDLFAGQLDFGVSFIKGLIDFGVRPTTNEFLIVNMVNVINYSNAFIFFWF